MKQEQERKSERNTLTKRRRRRGNSSSHNAALFDQSLFVLSVFHTDFGVTWKWGRSTTCVRWSKTSENCVAFPQKPQPIPWVVRLMASPSSPLPSTPLQLLYSISLFHYRNAFVICVRIRYRAVQCSEGIKILVYSFNLFFSFVSPYTCMRLPLLYSSRNHLTE